MDTKAQEFLKLYNDLDAILQERYHDYDRTHSQIMRYSSELSKAPYNSIAERGRKLNSIRQIRNLMIHDLDMNRDELIEISQSLIDELQYEIDALSKTKNAYAICTPISKLISATFDDDVYDLAIKMVDAGYMQLPILDKDRKLFGVLSPNAILKYLAENPTNGQSFPLESLKDYLPIDKHICECYAFVGRNDSISDLGNVFQNVYKKGKKLAMVFVTEHGIPDEAVLGIITAYDIVHLIQGE